jgi:hypothetical protein
VCVCVCVFFVKLYTRKQKIVSYFTWKECAAKRLNSA